MFKAVGKARRNEKGFTLVELMVVVVIIGVLVAIAVPIYQNVVNSASRKTIVANLRTIDGAIEMYRAENNALPENLAALSPNYLASIPAGPSPLTSASYGLNNGRATVTLTLNQFGATIAAGTYTLAQLLANTTW